MVLSPQLEPEASPAPVLLLVVALVASVAPWQALAAILALRPSSTAPDKGRTESTLSLTAQRVLTSTF